MHTVKQILVIRKDLRMRRGKEIAQGSHASMQFLTNRLKTQSNVLDVNIFSLPVFPKEEYWLKNGFKKVCVRVNSEQELLDLYERAKLAGIESHLILDEGLTEFAKPEYTALALGPDYSALIDPLTQNLELY